MLTLTDDELVNRCKTELPTNTRSFELLVQRHMNRVYTSIYRLVGNSEDAEDLTQETFVKAFNSLKNFEQKAAFTTWLHRIALNTTFDSLEKAKRRPAKEPNRANKPKNGEVEPLEKQAAASFIPEEETVKAELNQCINRVLTNLEKEQCQLLVMRDFDDLSYAEIAKVSNLGLSAVKMRIHRARLAFQKIFLQFCGKIHLPFNPYLDKKEADKLAN
jgi:RNA polymerase sigma-70 factor, ECF subfamily